MTTYKDMTLAETVTTLQGALERSQSTEGLVLSEHLETLRNLELAEGEEKECMVASLREVIEWAEYCITVLEATK